MPSVALNIVISTDDLTYIGDYLKEELKLLKNIETSKFHEMGPSALDIHMYSSCCLSRGSEPEFFSIFYRKPRPH